MKRAALILFSFWASVGNCLPCREFTNGVLKDLDLDRPGCYETNDKNTEFSSLEDRPSRKVFVTKRSDGTTEVIARKNDLFGDEQEIKYFLDKECKTRKIEVSDISARYHSIAIDSEVCLKLGKYNEDDIKSNPQIIKSILGKDVPVAGFFQIRRVCNRNLSRLRPASNPTDPTAR